MNCLSHTKGVRELPKPQTVVVGLTPGFSKCCLNVLDHENMSKSLPISKAVAEVLLSLGFSSEG